MDGISRLHALVAEHAPASWAELAPEQVAGQVVVGIETDRGPWVTALRAAGYQVFAINPLSAARYRQRHSTSGAKSDAGDAHVLAEIVRLDRDHHRQVAGDSDLADAVKLVARAHQSAVWDRTRHVLRLRSALLEFFPAALAAFAGLGLTGADTLELLARAPDPAAAAKLTLSQVSAALRRARRRDVPAKAAAIKDALRVPQLAQPAPVTAAYAAAVQAAVAVLTVLNEQIAQLEAQVEAHFLQHPDAEVYLSQPGIGTVNGSRVLAEFGDAPGRYASAKARKNYAGSSPVTRASGRSKVVLARFIRNDRLADALQSQALSALSASPGARAYYDKQRARGLGYNSALRQLSNRLVGILHGCLKTGTRYDEATAWPGTARNTEPLAA